MTLPFKPLALLARRQLKNKKILLRLDTNVPFVQGKVGDESRLLAALPTLDYLLAAKPKKIFILGHAGDGASLSPVAHWLGKKYALDFVADSEEAREAKNQIVLLENLRHDPREESGGAALAKELAGLGDLYVTDAFSVAHRDHASVTKLPRLLDSYAGLRFTAEYEALAAARRSREPLLLILGGAKFGTKLPVIETFLPKAEHIFIGGALAHAFFTKRQWEIGQSLVDDKAKLPPAVLKSAKIILPLDVVVTDKTSPRIKPADAVGHQETIVDAGPETVALLAQKLKTVKRVIWNGPLGHYEASFTKGTRDLAQAIVTSGVPAIVGGGDTLACLAGTDYLHQFSFVSLAGGAMLEFLAAGTLPGIKALTLKRRR